VTRYLGGKLNVTAEGTGIALLEVIVSFIVNFLFSLLSTGFKRSLKFFILCFDSRVQLPSNIYLLTF